MQLSTNTLEVLKNFSTLQNSIVLKEGSVVSTISGDRTVVGRAVIPESFSRDVPINNGLSQLLNTLKLFDQDPEIDLEEHYMRVSSGKHSQIFRYSDESFIMKPRTDPIENDKNFSYDLKITITNEDLTRLKKAAAIMGLPHLVFRGKDGKVSVVVCDATGKNGSSDNEFALDIGVETASEFQAVIKVGNLLIMGRDYQVSVAMSFSDMKVTKWESAGDNEIDVIYWLVVEADLSYFRMA